jgi:hypothetical protein
MSPLEIPKAHLAGGAGTVCAAATAGLNKAKTTIERDIRN